MKIAALIILLSFTFFTTKLKCQEERISKDFIQSVVNIENKNGEGSGFIVGIVHETDSGKKWSRAFLVTNKHMIGTWSPVDSFIPYKSILVHFYSVDSNSLSIPIELNLLDSVGKFFSGVKVHPDSKIDVAVIEITNVFLTSPNILQVFKDTSYLLPLNKVTSETTLGFGSQVFAIGYPAGIKMAKTNQPIGKAGYIASSLDGNLEVNFPWVDKNKKMQSVSSSGKFFLVDGLIIGGNSGGPIVNPNEQKSRFVNGRIETSQKPVPNLIIGIVSYGLPGTGISIIYAADHILELIRKF